MLRERPIKFIRDGLIRGNSSYDTVFVPQLLTVNEARQSVRLAEVCGFTQLDVKVMPEEDGCPSLEATVGMPSFDPKMDGSGLVRQSAGRGGTCGTFSPQILGRVFLFQSSRSSFLLESTSVTRMLEPSGLH